MSSPTISKKVSGIKKSASTGSDDKQWLLNAAAIKAARSCIRSVDQELGIRLTLSHPDFLILLSQYCELTDSPALQKSYAQLTQYFDRSSASHVTPINSKVSNPQITQASKSHASDTSGEYIVYKGRKFKRWHDGLEFQGLYRGQPRYS